MSAVALIISGIIAPQDADHEADSLADLDELALNLNPDDKNWAWMIHQLELSHRAMGLVVRKCPAIVFMLGTSVCDISRWADVYAANAAEILTFWSRPVEDLADLPAEARSSLIESRKQAFQAKAMHLLAIAYFTDRGALANSIVAHAANSYGDGFAAELSAQARELADHPGYRQRGPCGRA